MKKLLLTLIVTVLFISVSAQNQYFKIHTLSVCEYNGKEILNCNEEFNNSLFVITDGFRYISRHFDYGTEHFKVYNAYKIENSEIFSVDCYELSTREHYNMLVDYDNYTIYVEKMLFNNIGLAFKWIDRWTD